VLLSESLLRVLFESLVKSASLRVSHIRSAPTPTGQPWQMDQREEIDVGTIRETDYHQWRCVKVSSQSASWRKSLDSASLRACSFKQLLQYDQVALLIPSELAHSKVLCAGVSRRLGQNRPPGMMISSAGSSFLCAS
jgi:hypothetical protein